MQLLGRAASLSQAGAAQIAPGIVVGLLRTRCAWQGSNAIVFPLAAGRGQRSNLVPAADPKIAGDFSLVDKSVRIAVSVPSEFGRPALLSPQLQLF